MLNLRTIPARLSCPNCEHPLAPARRATARQAAPAADGWARRSARAYGSGAGFWAQARVHLGMVREQAIDHLVVLAGGPGALTPLQGLCILGVSAGAGAHVGACASVWGLLYGVSVLLGTFTYVAHMPMRRAIDAACLPIRRTLFAAL